MQRVRIFVLRPAISAAKSSTAACQIDSLMSQSKRFFGRGLSSIQIRPSSGIFILALFFLSLNDLRPRIGYTNKKCVHQQQFPTNRSKTIFLFIVPRCLVRSLPLHHSVAHVGDELDKLRAFAFRLQSLVGIAEGKRGLLLSFGSSHIPRGNVKSPQSLHMNRL